MFPLTQAWIYTYNMYIQRYKNYETGAFGCNVNLRIYASHPVTVFVRHGSFRGLLAGVLSLPARLLGCVQMPQFQQEEAILNAVRFGDYRPGN